ncbi:MAG: hypothetical protein HW419_1793 [Deltaproteobacteria bacterium]|nr:hypothetical protein [Deltaproteobacteria bacterium]
MVVLQIRSKLGRLGEGNDDYCNPAAVKFSLEGSHLDEVRLARQSRQVAQKNHQQPVVEMARQIRRRAVAIEQRQIREIDFSHSVETERELGASGFGYFKFDVSAMLRCDDCDNWG